MKTTWQAFALAAWCGAVTVAIACGGGSTSSPAPASACDHYFEALYSGNCSGAPLPSSERTRIQARFDQVCTTVVALPGISVTPSALDACANALAASGCSALRGPACAFGPGSLAVGASCVSDDQCQNGDCTAGSDAPDGGGPIVCGKCATGSNCADATCGPDTTCEINSSADGGTTGMCLPVTFGDAGAKCNGAQAQCKPGLSCNRAVGACSAPGAAGAPCADTSDCSGSLVCPVAPGSSASTCQSAGQAGASCVVDSDCAVGLGCDLAKRACAAITWAAAGQPCDGTARCLVGTCPWSPTGPTGACPAVIPDGKPCNPGDPAATCDTYAECAGGACVLVGSVSCP